MANSGNNRAARLNVGPIAEVELASAVEQILQRISEAGHKVTSARRVVVELILRQAGYFTSADICEALKSVEPGVGRATVFRTLDLLNEMHLVEKVHLADGCHRYLVCQTNQHHHLICSRCGTASDFDEPTLNELFQQLARQTRFRIRGHWIEVFGLCENCQEVEQAQQPVLLTV